MYIETLIALTTSTNRSSSPSEVRRTWVGRAGVRCTLGRHKLSVKWSALVYRWSLTVLKPGQHL